MKKYFALFLAGIFAAVSAQAGEIYKIDPVHSSINFKVRHFFSYVTGSFTKFEGTIDFDPDHPEKSSVKATIEAASIDTKNDRRDAHLRSSDFFDASKFPTITFRSKSVKQTGADRGDIVGDLTMHGVTKEVVLHAKLLGKGKGMDARGMSGWEATTEPIHRVDYGLNWGKNVGGTAVVGADVEVTIEIEADEGS
jgi:polyisoprenoid-binding protein YceI